MRSKKRFLSALVVLLIAVFGCGQWRVSALRSKKLCTLGKDAGFGGITIDYNESGALNLSFGIRISGDRIYLADNILGRLQVLNFDGSPALIIGKKVVKEGKDLPPQSQFNFGVIGSMVADASGNIYVQNRLAASGRGVVTSGSEIDFSPSYILVFDKNGNLQHTLGQRGTPDIPFYYIENLEVDKNNRLFVISRTFDTWSVYRFSGKKRDFFINLGHADFKDTEGEEVYTGKIENIKIFRTGESFLVAVAYYNKARFKYRKVFEYSGTGDKMQKTVLTVPDPKNEIFSLADDKYIYLWNVEGKKVKFVILNFDGNVINNVLVELRDGKYFEEIITDETGRIYSYHVNKTDMEIMEWK